MSRDQWATIQYGDWSYAGSPSLLSLQELTDRFPEPSGS